MTDWSAPGAGVLGRIHDARATQYWDPGHLLARKLADDAHAPQAPPNCCRRDGFLWDLAAFHPAGVRWTDSLPPAALFNGPVVKMKDAVAAAITK